MSEKAPDKTRRTFIKATGISALSGVAVPHVLGQETGNTIQVAIVGTGGRGGGAAAQAISVPDAPIKMVAMADVFEHKLDRSYQSLAHKFKDQPDCFDVPEDQRFLGFAAYKKAMDCLKPGDIVILTTPLAFRWVHFSYAIEKGLHVFMEKPLTADGPTSRRMIELAKKASDKNLKVGVGLMVRHCHGRQELHKRISDGEIGDIQFMRAYRMHGPVGSAFTERKPDDISETMWQIQKFHSFLWASGGLFNDFYIHQVDELSWMKNAWPVKAHALGGRHYRKKFVDQNFDTYSVEYTYDDGTKLFLDGRTMLRCYNNMSSTIHGTRGSAIVSSHGHTPGKVRTFKGQKQVKEDLIWAYPQPEKNPYQLEWNDLVDAIIHDKPYNEVERGVMASLASSLGRMSAHTGREVAMDEIMNSDHEFAPDVANLAPDGPAPLQPHDDGSYPVPAPGITTKREYIS
jgi:predicted dehydrogenase